MNLHPKIRDLLQTIRFPFLFVVLLWVLWLLDTWLELDMYKYGILPRELKGLKGVLFSPLVHNSYGHILSNSVPLLLLGICMFYFYRNIAFQVFFLVYFTTGFFVWLFARSGAYHVGASGIIYGFVCFLFYSGIFRKNRQLFALSLLVTFLYGSLIFGVSPFRNKRISWESHLIGAISGGITAFYLRRKGPANDTYSWSNAACDEEFDAEDSSLYRGPFKPAQFNRLSASNMSDLYHSKN